MSGMSSPPAGLGQSHRWHRRSPGAQAAELCRAWQELCVRERQARDRNRQLLQEFGQLEAQLGLLWARTDAVRRRKVDYEEFLQRLLQRMKAGSPGRVPQHQDWVSTWMLDLPLRSRPGRHLPDSPEQMDHLRHQTPWPHPVSPQSPEPAAFLVSTGAGGAGPTEATRPPGGPHREPWLHPRPIAKDGGYRLLSPMRHRESAQLLPPHRLSFPNTAEWKGARPQPMQTRACAGAGSHTEAAASSGLRHRHRTANGASRRLLWRGAWEQDSTETAYEESWDRVPRLWHKKKPGGDTVPLDQGGSWGQEPWGEQAGDDGSEEVVGSPRWGLSVRGRQPGRNRDPREGVELKEEVGHLLIQGVGRLEEGEEGDGCSAMGQSQEEGEEEEGLAEGQRGQEVGGKDEECNREEGSGGAREEGEAEGRRSKEGSVLGHVQGEKGEEGLVERGGQEEEEEEGLAGDQEEKDHSEREEGLVWGQEGSEDEESRAKGPKGQNRTKEEESEEEEEEVLVGWGAQAGDKEEEGLVEWGGQEQDEEEESSEEEEGLAGRGGQAQGEEEESSEEEEGLAGRGGQVQGEEEESSEEEEGLAGRGGQAQGEEEESSEEEEGLAGWGVQEQGEEEDSSKEEEGLVGQQGGQEGGEDDEGSEGPAVGAEGHVQEEEDADSDLVLGPQGGPGSGVELGRGSGRDPPDWNSPTLKAPHGRADLGQDSSWGEEEEEAESEADDDIEAALAPPGNATEPRVKRTLESHERRSGNQGSPPLQEGSREVSGQGDLEQLEADLETSLREDRSLDDQDSFYD